MFAPEQAQDKVMMGTERRSLVIPEQEKKITAYHEAGHAIVAWFLPETDMVHKVTVIPRGRALGLTHWLPKNDRHTYGQPYLEETMAAIMGGRAAEEIIFGNITNGAANDIERCTEIAHKMVCEWGMSEKMGPLQFGKKDEMVFLGKEMGHAKDFSEATARLIDEEISRIVTTAHELAQRILNEKVDLLKALAEELLDQEIMDRLQIAEILGQAFDDDDDDDEFSHDEIEPAELGIAELDEKKSDSDGEKQNSDD